MNVTRIMANPDLLDGLSHLLDLLPPVGGEEEVHGAVVHLAAASEVGVQHAPYGRAAVGEAHPHRARRGGGVEVLDDPGALGGLAGAVATLERDQEAAPGGHC